MKIKTFDDKKLKIIALGCLLYITNLPQVYKYTDSELLFKTNILTILDLFFISCLATFIPCIYYLNKGEKFEEETGKRICLYNSLLIFAIGLLSSIFMVKTYGYYYLVSNFLGSIIFYFLNLLLFVNVKTKCYFIANIVSYLLIISSVIIVILISIKYVRSSIDPPNYRIEDIKTLDEIK